LSSMRPSSKNGVGAMAKVPAALDVSFIMGLCVNAPPLYREMMALSAPRRA
jgi:hypothetical protein